MDKCIPVDGAFQRRTEHDEHEHAYDGEHAFLRQRGVFQRYDHISRRLNLGGKKRRIDRTRWEF